MNFRRFDTTMLCGLFLLGSSVVLHANPADPTIISGSVSFSTDGGTLDVNSSSTRSIIDWDTFSVGSNETVNFNLPSANAAILNRVTSSSWSNVLGEVNSNGKVYLVNPNGILIGPDSVITASSFLASTLNPDNDEFLAGLDMLFTGAADDNTFVINYGTITATAGDVVLLGYQVQNSGDMTAENGFVSCGAGMEIVLQYQGDQRLVIQPSSAVTTAFEGMAIDGYISALHAELKADGNLYELAINYAGWIDARGNAGQDGLVRFEAANGSTFNNGIITNLNYYGIGSRVDMAGDEVNLGGSCIIDVSGPSGGGVIYVGGGFNGNEPDIVNATTTVVDGGALLEVSALYSGPGGQVAVWSENSTTFGGILNAMGGQQEGDGGLVQLPEGYGGTVDVTAPHGDNGIILTY